MAYPHDDRLKSAIERLNQVPDPIYSAHPYDDKVFHGIIVSVALVDGDDACGSGYLKVSPLVPTADSDGTLHFVDPNTNPMTGLTNARYDRVWCDNVPLEWWNAYFHKGDIITYRQYTGYGDLSKTVRGSFVTHVADLRFKAIVEPDCTCGDSSGAGATSGGSGNCSVHGTPSLGSCRFPYKFQAAMPNPSAGPIDQKWIADPCDTGLSGRCYNLYELFNESGKTGTGVDVDSDGVRLDDNSGQSIQPIGKIVTDVFPVLDPNSGRCDFREFYFAAMNQFAMQDNTHDDCCSSSSESSESSSSAYHCVYLWTAQYDCTSGDWSDTQYEGVNCQHPPAKIDQWYKAVENNAKTICTYYYYKMLSECSGSEQTASCPDKPDDPQDPIDYFGGDPPDCCGSSSESESSHSSGQSNKCIFLWTCDYHCDSIGWDDPQYIGLSCEAEPATVNKWYKKISSADRCRYYYYHVGGDCKGSAETNNPSGMCGSPEQPPTPQSQFGGNPPDCCHSSSSHSHSSGCNCGVVTVNLTQDGGANAATNNGGYVLPATWTYTVKLNGKVLGSGMSPQAPRAINCSTTPATLGLYQFYPNGGGYLVTAFEKFYATACVGS